MANRVAGFAHDTYLARRNYRGGHARRLLLCRTTWAFGKFTGGFPSGRLASKAFTPGLTPEPNASRACSDNIRDVAKLDPHNMNNNIASREGGAGRLRHP